MSAISCAYCGSPFADTEYVKFPDWQRDAETQRLIVALFNRVSERIGEEPTAASVQAIIDLLASHQS